MSIKRLRVGQILRVLTGRMSLRASRSAVSRDRAAPGRGIVTSFRSSTGGSPERSLTGAAKDITLLILTWGVLAAVVNPAGEFPLNDDWAYAQTLRHLLTTGDYHPLGNTTMTLVTNVVWGALFCLPAGFSFTALRISTLIAALIGILGIYVFARELGRSRQFSLFAAAGLAFNPIFFGLSYTFMTDVPFAATSIWATLFFWRALKSDRPRDIVAGTLFALAATLSRQLGICVPLAYGCCRLIEHTYAGSWRRRTVTAVIPAAVCIGSLVIFLSWMKATGRLPALYGFQTQRLLQTFTDARVFARTVSNNLFIITFYVGLFLLTPLMMSNSIVQPARGSLRKILPIVIGLSTLLAAVIARSLASLPIQMPLTSNIVLPSGMGPLTLRDTFLLKLDDVPTLSAALWGTVTLLSFAGAAILLVTLIRWIIETAGRIVARKPGEKDGAQSLFLLLCAAIYALPLVVASYVYDRYLIPAVLFLTLWIASLPAAHPKAVSFVTLKSALGWTTLAAFAWFSVAITHDYLTWNRLRWTALNDLTHKRHIPATEIDGEYEFNGLLLYDEKFDLFARLRDNSRSYWWVQDDTYMIGFGPIPGYQILDRYPGQIWLGGPVQIVVMRRSLRPSS